jgi:plasmid maintenance system antidote protein VapI
MAMHNPPHPGAILKEDVLPELGLMSRLQRLEKFT